MSQLIAMRLRQMAKQLWRFSQVLYKTIAQLLLLLQSIYISYVGFGNTLPGFVEVIPVYLLL
jgi:hypothetical protein